MANYSVGQEIRPGSAVPTGSAPGNASFSYGQLSPTAPGKVIGSQTVNGKLYYNIDQKYIGGGTGWVDASALDTGGAPSSPQPASAAPAPSSSSDSSTARQDFVNSLYSTFNTEDAVRQSKVDAARKALTDYYASLEDPTVRFQRINEEQGVTQQQNLVNSLTKDVMGNQDLIDALEGSVNTRVGDFLMNDAQRVALLARERYPLEQNLTKLLRQKQYEEVGLQGKQQLVQELLQLSLQNDQIKAKPLELNVDFSNQDLTQARSIFQSIASNKIQAFDMDLASKEAKAKEERDRAFQEQQQKEKFANDIALENLRTQNDITKYNQTTGSKTSQKNVKAQAQAVYNNLLGGSNSEYELWKKIMDNRDMYSKMGIIDELWNLHGQLKATMAKSNITKTNNSNLKALQGLVNAGF